MSSVTTNLPLQYQREILDELLAEDGFLILGRGLGLRHIICALLKIYSHTNHLVILLNTPAHEEIIIKEELAEIGVRKPGLRVVNNEMGIKERSELYLSGGIMSITSRILIVDLLTKRIPSYLITGILVNHAERVNETSIEAFILREGFIKAFSDSPESFTGFSPLQTTLQYLQLRKVFHVTIRECLEERKVEVIELYQSLSNSMREIQSAILECIEACVAELRKTNIAWLDIEDLTVEQAFFRSFDHIIRQQLDPVWHRVGQKTKFLIGDLTMLRKLLTYLVSYDCVTFHSFLETILASQTPSSTLTQEQQSPWIFMDSGNTIFSVAKSRVYLRETPKNIIDCDDDDGNGANDKGKGKETDKIWHPPGIVPVLEELPKWGLLAEIVNEIELEIESLSGLPTSDEEESNNIILIMAENERECSQLREYLSTMHKGLEEGQGRGGPLLRRLLQNYFKWKGDIAKVSNNLFNASKASDQSEDSQESNNKNATSSESKKQYQRGQQPPNKRRRVRGGSIAAAVSSTRSTVSIIEEEAKEIANFINHNITSFAASSTQKEASKSSEMYDDDEFDAKAFSTYFGLLPLQSLVIIRPISGDDDRMLETLKPKYIIIYHPDQRFVRRVETFRAIHPGISCKVYFMVYENSVEEQRYLSAIRKEKEAFEKLIHENSVMAIPLGKPRIISRNPDDMFLRTANTRIAGGREIAQPIAHKIIVDIREFRCSLPSLLHAHGIEILPCTLKIGDYILSPDICVERKSISDLIGSFTSGRLYTQCEAMSIYYKQPVLLIEFEQNQTFTLQAINDLKSDINIHDISSKLVMLTLTFPRVKIIWSSSPHATVQIFEDLKESRDQPDLETAQSIGVENEDITDYNLSPQDILRALPGITAKNYKHIMSKVENLRELTELSLRELQILIGAENGKTLYEFLERNS
ncbi:14528_t:CDS:10 [Cetraspora pellucida]|uniref:14528_t:CDS:1 n=1 Tax=Cetraspora pellucida TaxID=1433469 RepID=A0ACA9KFI4_9GLOM|nr:14528_t:CDS:10 [Cetraspora pellucida]